MLCSVRAGETYQFKLWIKEHSFAYNIYQMVFPPVLFHLQSFTKTINYKHKQIMYTHEFIVHIVTFSLFNSNAFIWPLVEINLIELQRSNCKGVSWYCCWCFHLIFFIIPFYYIMCVLNALLYDCFGTYYFLS